MCGLWNVVDTSEMSPGELKEFKKKYKWDHKKKQWVLKEDKDKKKE